MNRVNYFRTIALAFVALATVSCSDKEADEPEQQSAITMPSGQALSQTVYADQTEGASVSFTTTGDWTTEIGETATTVKAATAVPAWLSINPASGRAGENTFAVSLEPNDTGADRSAQITISSGNEQANVTVTQKSTTQDGKPYGKKYDIYIAGNGGAANWHAAYWKNGEIKVLNNASQYTYGNDIAVSGDDVYLAGIEFNPYPSSGISAKLWKNGVESTLPGEGNNNYADAIAVSGTDVYVAGTAEHVFSSPYRDRFAKYWKNGQSVTIVDYSQWLHSNYPGNPDAETWGPPGTYGHAIAVQGSDVYVAGRGSMPVTLYTNTPEIGQYWKNGMVYPLTNTSILKECKTFQAWGIAVSEGNVHAVGYGNHPDADKENWDNRLVAAYWKNGAPTYLGREHWQSTARAVAVDGDDVYVAGTIRLSKDGKFIAVYWKNGVEVRLYGTGNSYVGRDPGRSITVVDGDVYVLGYVDGIGSVYWKNGQMFTLGQFSGRSITVVPHSATRHW